MLAFRHVASKEMARQQIWTLTDIPGFYDWFFDWTIPMPWRGQRITLPTTLRRNLQTDPALKKSGIQNHTIQRLAVLGKGRHAEGRRIGPNSKARILVSSI